MKNVEIFKTNVQHKGDADELIQCLRACHPDYEITLDLEDCDKVLRIVSHSEIDCDSITRLLGDRAFEAIPL